MIRDINHISEARIRILYWFIPYLYFEYKTLYLIDAL